MEESNTIGTKIKKIRELRNFTQEYMAEQLGLSQAGYGNIERDDTDVTLSRLTQIAKVLKVSLQELLGFDEKTIFSGVVNNHATGGLNGVIFNSDTFERERKLYENQIESLKEEIKHLKGVLEKVLMK